MHEGIASPLRCTTQQPQMAMPQPYFVPVRPRSSRRTHSKGFSGSVSTETDWPFTLKRNSLIGAPSFWTRAAMLDPLCDFSHKVRVVKRWRGPAVARIPAPQHERIVTDV